MNYKIKRLIQQHFKQSLYIKARYLAKKFGLAGKTDEESLIIDMYKII